MENNFEFNIKQLREIYAAFNSRNIDVAITFMTDDVAWPRAFKGGFVVGPKAVGEYWTEQWSEIDPNVEPISFHQDNSGSIVVEVHQLVRDLAGTLLADDYVGHRFTMAQGLINRMEVCESPVLHEKA